MGSDKKRSAASEEYQYAGEDLGEESLLETPQKRPLTLQALKAKLIERLPKKKKYRVLLFLALGVYILYKFLDVGTPPAKVSTPTPEKIASQSLAKPADEKVQPVVKTEGKKVEKPVAIPAAMAPAKPGTKNIDLGVVNNTSGTEPSAQIKELQTSLDQMNHSVTVLESSLLSLTSSVIRLSDKVNALEKSRTKSIPAANIKPPVLLVYYLQSLTTGRAWVESSVGDFTTVKVGDSLPGYGQVKGIDVRAGNISTSSGRMIYYGPNDS